VVGLGEVARVMVGSGEVARSEEAALLVVTSGLKLVLNLFFPPLTKSRVAANSRISSSLVSDEEGGGDVGILAPNSQGEGVVVELMPFLAVVLAVVSGGGSSLSWLLMSKAFEIDRPRLRDCGDEEVVN